MDFKYVLDRLKEPSTWTAIALLVGIVGVNFSEELQTTAINAAGAAAVLINIFWKKDSQSKT